jgi:flagellar hook-basal body protein
MSFYTSLTGLNAATAMLGVTANNISNVGTTGFKRSRADFGDIFATSPLQKASSTVGQGVSLKQVSQEFSQGNISFSANALDLAITGDGFFPLRSADGLTDTYTRNGSFSLNEQFNVVNSAGQRLMAATVDSTGSANVNDRVVLSIPQKTSGEAKQTSFVSLGLNFPADATVITTPFNREDPSTFNKSTAFTVYDNGGNGYLATIYYVKSQNANQDSPFNKWQTYVFVGEDQVQAAIAQSTDATGDLQYVNQYGQIKSFREVKDELTTAKTQMISLDELTDKRVSSPASITGVASTVDLTGGTNTFAQLKSLPTPIELDNLFTVNVDSSTEPIKVDLSYLKDSSTVLTGAQLASEATKFLNRKFGNESTFNFTSTLTTTNPDEIFGISNSRIQNGSPVTIPITLSGFADKSNVSVLELTQIIQTQVDNSVLGGHARESITLTGNATGQVEFLGKSIMGSAADDLPSATATKIVNDWKYAQAATYYEPNAAVTAATGAEPTSFTVAAGLTAGNTYTISVSGTAKAAGTFNFVATGVAATDAALIRNNINSLGDGTDAGTASVGAGVLSNEVIMSNGTVGITIAGIRTPAQVSAGVTQANAMFAVSADAATSAMGKFTSTASGWTVGKTASGGLTNPWAAIALEKGLENIELGNDKTFVVLTYHQNPRQSVAISGIATDATVFMGTTVAPAPASGVTGNSPSATCSAIVAHKAEILLGTAAKSAGIIDIQIDPKNSSQLILVYDQTQATRDTYTPTLTGGNVAASSVVLNNINEGLSATSGVRPTQEVVPDSNGVAFSDSSVLSAGLAKSPMTVTYDYNSQSFKFTDSTNAGANIITLIGGSTLDSSGQSSVKPNAILGLGTGAVTLDSDGLSGIKMLPNNKNPIRSLTDQRYGMQVKFDAVSKSFTVSSGTTGDGSAITISDVSASGLSLLGLPTNDSTTGIGAAVYRSNVALRGIASGPAVAVGKAPTVNVANNFAVDATNNKFVVTVDGIKGTVIIPPSATYSLASFTRELQKGINSLASADGDSPTTVNGVKVTYDYTQNVFKFTTGTQGSDSFIKISGSSAWGLDQVEAARGTTSSWIKPSQHKDMVGGALAAKFIDKDGKETTNGDGFTSLPAWSPIFLDKGELTFNTAGKLFSPLQGTQLETVYLEGGKGALTINVDYAASTQFTSPFAVLSQSQDGAPEGSLVGVTIGNDGLVSASFSNGTQKSLAKILITNFSSPSGLRQIGDSSFLASASSGKPILGAAGSAGFGTLRAGATERANVDLTQELVDLITAQRNFQANAKAIETSSTMTSAIINLRS